MAELLDRGMVTSVQYDLNRVGTGASPYPGDLNSTGIAVPIFPTGNQNRRYLFRLCGLEVPADTICVITALHQLLYIGAKVPAEDGEIDETWLLEVPVEDPLWSFPDGNVSWHLRNLAINSQDRTIFTDFIFPPGSTNRGDTTDSALISRQPPAGGFGYEPLNGGLPYGKDLVPGLGTWRDMRFPWHHCQPNLNLQVKGPMTIGFFASIYQTDPARRPNKPVIIETAGLRREDVFMLNYPDAVYTRVGGRIIYDMIPCPARGDK